MYGINWSLKSQSQERYYHDKILDLKLLPMVVPLDTSHTEVTNSLNWKTV